MKKERCAPDPTHGWHHRRGETQILIGLFAMDRTKYCELFDGNRTGIYWVLEMSIIG